MGCLYLECRMGAAEDMLLASLYELCEQKELFLETMNGLHLLGVSIEIVPEQKCGICGSRAVVKVGCLEEESMDHSAHAHEDGNHTHTGHAHDHTHEGHAAEHEHSGLADIQALIQGLPLPQEVKNDAIAVYDALAQAEAHVHGKTIEHVHFHEVGALDAVADIVGVCLLMHMLQPEEITASPVHIGSGQVKTAHGILPVPAPATAHLLRGIPTYSDGIYGELCTPTGAALLRHFVHRFGNMPAMAVAKTGYGMGKKNFPAANCVRAFWGECFPSEDSRERLTELRCNIDDMTPEAIGFATQSILAEGALDLYVQPVYMKKNRPGFVVVCLCREDDAERFVRLLFRHTSTLGVRAFACGRYTLRRSVEERELSLGTVRMKRAQGYGVTRSKPEYEDVARLAREHGLPFGEAYERVLKETNPHES